MPRPRLDFKNTFFETGSLTAEVLIPTCPWLRHLLRDSQPCARLSSTTRPVSTQVSSFPHVLFLTPTPTKADTRDSSFPLITHLLPPPPPPPTCRIKPSVVHTPPEPARHFSSFPPHSARHLLGHRPVCGAQHAALSAWTTLCTCSGLRTPQGSLCGASLELPVLCQLPVLAAPTAAPCMPC